MRPCSQSANSYEQNRQLAAISRAGPKLDPDQIEDDTATEYIERLIDRAASCPLARQFNFAARSAMKRKALAVTLRRKKIQKMLESERAGKQLADRRTGELQTQTEAQTQPQSSWGVRHASSLKH
jgi:hypothetical protein